MEHKQIKQKEYLKKYREQHPLYMIDYYKNNKEKYSLKIKCDCGYFYAYSNKNKHYKTKKHLNNID